MGGHQDGEIASRIATDSLSDVLHLSKIIQRSIYDLSFPTLFANYKVLQKQDEIKNNMATTNITVLTYCDIYTWINFGDSRLYKYDNKELKQISVDDSTPEGYITRYIGDPNFYRHKIRCGQIDRWGSGDYLLLCTDGLTNMISDETIQQVLEKYKEPKKIAKLLLQLALDEGGRDNITLTVIQNS